MWKSPDIRLRDDAQISENWLSVMTMIINLSDPYTFRPTFSYFHTRHNILPGADRILECLTPSLHRLNSFELHLPVMASNALATFPTSTDTFPVLQGLTMCFYDSVLQQAIVEHPILAFASAPHLKEVILSYEPAIWGEDTKGRRLLRSLVFPWSQLTMLHIDGIYTTAQDAQDLLRQCHSIEDCDLGSVSMAGEHLAMDPCILKHLHHFALEVLYEPDDDNFLMQGSARFFQPFVMPQLSNLELTCGPRAFEAPEYISFLYSRSGSTLTDLRLHCVPFDGDDIVQTLALLPMLELFRAHKSHAGTDILFEALCYDPKATTLPIVPRLKDLAVTEYPTEADMVTSDRVRDVIMSRWWSDAHLSATRWRPSVARWQKIYLDWFGGHVDMDILALLDINDCREEGLNVTLNWHGREERYLGVLQFSPECLHCTNHSLR